MSTPEPTPAPAPAPAPAAVAAVAPQVVQTGSHAIRIPLGSGLLFAAAALLVVWYVATQTTQAAALQFSEQGLRNIGLVMAPLVAIALFIERAVEVLITAWRDPGAVRLKHDMALAPADRAAGIKHELDHYRMGTQRLSFLAAFTLSLVAAMVGINAVTPLLGGLPADASQAAVLRGFDVIVTALLLTGGADGLHQIVTTFTDFLDNSKARMNAGGANGAQG